MTTLGKKLGQLRQWTGEKFGNASKTEVSADFKDLIKETDERKEHTERVHKACLSFVMSMTNRKLDILSIGGIAEDTKIPSGQLATATIELGTLMRLDSEYGKTLIRFGEGHEKLGSHQQEFVQSVQMGYIAELDRVLGDMKEYARLKSKLENRRLDYDAKMNKVQKTKKENQTLEEEARVAQAKYEETLGVLWDKMVEIESNEQDQIRELVQFVDAEVEFFKKCLETVELLKVDLSNLLPGIQYNSQKSTANSARRVPSSNPSSDELKAQRRSHLSRSSKEELGMSESPRYPGGLSPSVGISPAASRQRTPISGVSRSTSSNSVIGKMAPPIPPQSLPYREPEPEPATKQVRVLFDFEAEGPGELTIQKGDIITVTNEIDEGWWEGEILDGSGRAGMFPANYTEVIVASTTSSPRKPIPLRPTLQSTYSSPVLGSNEDRARLASLPSSQPHSRKPSSSFSAANTTSVRNCIDCGCDEFAENHFKPGVCRTCFHKH